MEYLVEEKIKDKIYTFRDKPVILDSDLASFYEIPVKVFNQAIKRNIKRFPEDFMFQLTDNEVEVLRSQIVTTNVDWSKKHYLPYVFTEQGVANSASVKVIKYFSYSLVIYD